MSAVSRARTWSANRRDGQQEATAAWRQSSTATATSITAEQKTISTHVSTTVKEDAAAAAAATQQETDPVAHPTFLQPRVAAVLGVSRWWHPILFGLRLLSILPSIYLGFPLAIRFLLKLHAFATSEGPLAYGRTPWEDRLLLTETMLAIIWCGCSGYLSFFFTDCLMSRW